ncbi:MAG TPA: hypothetical protein PL089_14500 [Ignavibacteria bacterium]|nr:hypothetical protein [Ignavibacteria bacterium]
MEIILALQNFKKYRSIEFDFSLTCNDPTFVQLRDSIFTSIRPNLGLRKLSEKKDYLTAALCNLKRNLLYDSPNIPNFVGVLINKNYYSGINQKYRLPIQSYEVVKQVIEELDNLQLIEFHPGYKGKNSQTGLSSKMRAIGSLQASLSQIGLNQITTQQPTEFIILKDINGNEINYIDTPYTDAIRNDIIDYSALRESTVVSLMNIPVSLINQSSYLHRYIQSYSKDDLSSLPATGNVDINVNPEYLVRIFNTSFNKGGRFYRGVETGMPSDIRTFFQFNNNPTIELDYSGSHLRMLYHRNNMRINKDPYLIPVYPANPYRDYFKYSSLTMINASSEDSAIRSIMRNSGMELVQGGYLSSKGLKDSIKKLCDDFKKHHKRISSAFYSGAGLSLMKIDSEIANDILKHFTGMGIFVMCIHDSFIIDKQHEKVLRAKMVDFYKERVGKSPVIK